MNDGKHLDRAGVVTALAAADGVVILPTDTLPGLHARLDRPEAMARMRRLKGREETKPFLVLCASPDVVATFVETIAPSTRRYLARLWPGPFTAILPAATGLPDGVVGPGGTVAVRVPEPERLRDILAETGPLASSSVNRAGAEPAPSLEIAAVRFPDLPVWQAAWPVAGGQASALVDLTGQEPRERRSGPLPLPAWDDPLS